MRNSKGTPMCHHTLLTGVMYAEKVPYIACLPNSVSFREGLSYPLSNFLEGLAINSPTPS